MDLPPTLHSKLVCVAKRGRFSHIVPPRVWQAPNGRVLEILDDSLHPPSLAFLEHLEAFETLVDIVEMEEEKRLKEHSSSSDPLHEVHFSQWDPFLRYRSHIYPQPQRQESGSQVVYWVRYGCLRTRNNFALSQLEWLLHRTKCEPIVICFHSSMVTADDKAYFSALQALSTTIPLLCFEATENSIASFFALWVRHFKTRCILTTETYTHCSLKTNLAVSRSVPCPLIAFDSEHVVPIWRQCNDHTTVTITPPARFSFPVLLPSVTELTVPVVIEKRWKQVDMKQTVATISPWKEIENCNDLQESGLILAHCRLGTLSPLSLFPLPVFLQARSDAIFHQVAKRNDLSSPSQSPKRTNNETSADPSFLMQHNWCQLGEEGKMDEDVLRMHLVGFTSAEREA